jgi:hypothetical protein
MGYEISLDKARRELEELSVHKEHKVPFLSDPYLINIEEKSVLSQSSGKPADDFLAVLILHYMIGVLKHGYRPGGEFVSFKEIWGGNSFYPAFRKSTIIPLVKGLKSDPEKLLKNFIDRFGGRIVDGGDVSIEIAAFPGVPVRVVMWYGDEELMPEATILFDRSLAEIISTEDIAVLLQSIVETALCMT